MKKIAYLAPELPSLSATFVFNEIVALRKLGLEIHTYSVHRPKHRSHGPAAEKMANETVILYEQNLLSVISAFSGHMLKNRQLSLNAIKILYQDMTHQFMQGKYQNYNDKCSILREMLENKE